MKESSQKGSGIQLLSFSHKNYNPYIGKESMNSKANYMEVLTVNKIKEMMKKLKNKVVDIWNDYFPVKFGPYMVLNWFAGGGIAFWILWLIGKFYCLITHKEMRLVFESKTN